MSARTILLVASIVSTGLVAGFFFGWIVASIPGLKVVSDRTYVTTMQSINRAIINPAFIGPFMGTPFLLAAAALLEWRAGNTRRAWVLVSAAVTYFFGVVAVTVGGNIPLNDALEAFESEGASDESVAGIRHRYEGPWNRWHYVRTTLNVVAFGLAAASALVTVDAE